MLLGCVKGNLFLISQQNWNALEQQHEIYMERCLQLAANGLGSTYPNPLVGCVIVHKGRIIGEGWHRKAGEPHAEVIAVESVKDKSLLRDSELYVNLEPCSHHGRTPPCADLIVRHGIPRVYIGSHDDNELVSGRGIKRMREHGIEVTSGILEDSCRRLNRRFYTFHGKRRPYVILKWAESADGFVFPDPELSAPGQPFWISNPFSRQLVHKWRAEEQAILVGRGTVEQDDPSLTARDYAGDKILRLVIDREASIRPDKKVLDGESDTVVFSGPSALERLDREGSGQNSGKVIRVALDFAEDVPGQIMEYLHRAEVQSLIVEGGPFTLGAFIRQGLWDEARVFVGSRNFNKGLAAPRLKERPFREQVIADDRLLWFSREHRGRGNDND